MQGGICAHGFGGEGWHTIINCCSMGNLSVLNGTSSLTVGAISKTGGDRIHKNCYYLSGIQGIFTLSKGTGDILFYQTSEDPEVQTTATVVEALNGYIESNEDDIDTTGWCQWVVGENNLPALDFTKEWNGTSWITVNS